MPTYGKYKNASHILPAFVAAEHDLCAHGARQRRLHGSGVDKNRENVIYGII